MNATDLVVAVRSLSRLSVAERVEAYNAIQLALGSLVADVAPDPACAPQLVAAGLVVANDYNPNRVASTELDLLEQSMRADGITMCIVVSRNEARELCTVVDGFHRRTVAAERLGRTYLPCAILEKPPAERMASTVRHNRARGKHQVDLMASLTRAMLEMGMVARDVAARMGMTEEELLRLTQIAGVAHNLAAVEYGDAWQGRDGTDHPDA